jgi:hypothetical protein
VDRHEPSGDYRTPEVDGVWFSLSPSVLPPDDRPDWLDLHRCHEDGIVVLGRFRGLAAAIDAAHRRFGIDPSAWRREDG